MSASFLGSLAALRSYLGGSVASNLIIGQSDSPSAPFNVVAPAISGTTQQGQMLSTTDGLWSGYPSPGFTYQWKRGGVNIAGATSQTYTLVPADVGANITVTVTAMNGSGSASATSSAVGPITTVPSTGGALRLADGISFFSLAGSGRLLLAQG